MDYWSRTVKKEFTGTLMNLMKLSSNADYLKRVKTQLPNVVLTTLGNLDTVSYVTHCTKFYFYGSIRQNVRSWLDVSKPVVLISRTKSRK